MKIDQYRKTIENHVRVFEAGDKPVFDKLVQYYQGRFYTAKTGDSESELLATSVNLIYAVLQTAMSSLVPANPAITAIARSPDNEEQIKAVEAVVNLALDNSDYRDEMGFYIFDGVLLGRGVTKTTWSVRDDLPVCRACDPRVVFFDLTTRRQKDIRYWIEATLLSPQQYQSRFIATGTDEEGNPAKPMYSGEENRLAEPDAYPKWMLPTTNGANNTDELKNFQKWYLVYEIHDIEDNRVVHLLAGHDEPLMTDTLIYCPYDILTLNHNGEDCRGLSEIALISPNQEEVNHLLTYWLNIVRACVPKGAYDPGGIDGEQLQNAIAAGVGTWSPLHSKNGKPLEENLANFPMPSVPADAFNLLEYTVGNISKVSALAAAQRGQVTGARTATELALIQGEIRNLLASRQRQTDKMTVSIAGKFLFLLQKFKSKDAVVELTGQKGWHPVTPTTLKGIEATFKVVAYSPLESNRAVVQEQFKDLLQFLVTNPEVDQRQLLKAIIEIFDNPALRQYDILRPKQEPQAPVGPAGAPLPPPGPGAPLETGQTPLPPTMQAISDAQAGPAMTNAGTIAPPGPPVGGPLPQDGG